MQLYLEILSGQLKGELRHLQGLEIIRVGRNPESDLNLEDLGISFDHAEIRMRHGSYWVVDCGSTNGTYVNGERAYNSKLREGDVLKFGKKGPELRYCSRFPALGVGSGALKKSKPDLASGVRVKPAGLEASKPRKFQRAGSEDSLIVSEGAQRLDSNFVFQVQASEKSPLKIRVLWALMIAMALAVALLVLLWQRNEAVLLWQKKEAEIEVLSGKLAKKSAKFTALTEQLGRTKQQLDEARMSVSRLEKSRQIEEKRFRKAAAIYTQQLNDTRRQIQKLRAQRDERLARSEVSDRVKFREIQKRYNKSVVFVFTHLFGQTQSGKTVNLSSTGTGFIVTRQGHLITNKHVVWPWKFSKLAVKLARENITIDKDSYYVAVWLAGQKFWDNKRRVFNLKSGFSTRFGTLSEYASAADEWVTQFLRRGPREIKVHSPGSNNDIVVLKIRANRRFSPVVTFGVNDLPLRRLDPVMVLGFPLGVSILESEIAETSQNIGSISKIQNSIWIAGSLHPGNSGGPVFNSAGRVIGISTRIVGSENIGACIKIEHALKLLGGAW